MSAANRRKGRSFEVDMRRHLETAGLRIVKPNEGQAVDDGDAVTVDHHPPLVFEMKNYGNISAGLRMGVQEATAAAERFDAVPICLLKRRGVGDPGRQFAVLELDQFLRLIRPEVVR